MRSKLLFLIMLIVALAAFCSTASANILSNADMSDPCGTASPTTGDDDPCNWWTWGSDASNGGDSTEEFLNDKVDGTTEARSWKMYGHIRAGEGAYANMLPPWTPVEEGKTYYVGMYLKDILPGAFVSEDVRLEFMYSTAADGSGRDDTYQHFLEGISVAKDGEYHFISGETIVIPAGIGAISVGVNSGENSEFNVDDGYVDITRHPEASGVYGPVPAHGSKVVPPGGFPTSLTLKFRKYGGMQGDELTIDEVWWNAGAKDCNDNNFDAGKVLLPHLDPNTASATIVAGKNYYWRADVIDPNGGNGGAPPPILKGSVWHFSTVNSPPEVDAGMKQAMWQDGTANPVTFQLAPTVSDDGLPAPTSLTFLWTDSGPGAVAYSTSAAEEAPTATMSVVGDYILTLSVDDGSGLVTDTVKLRVHAHGTTGLEARYDMDEGAGAVGIHDDFSGVVKNPTGTPGSFDYSNGTRRGERMVTIGELNTAAAGITATTMDTTGGHCADGDGPNVGALVLDGGEGFVLASNTFGEPNENAPGGAVRSWADFENEVSVAAWVKIEAGRFNKNYQSIICNGNTSYRLQQAGNSNSVAFAVNVTNDDGDKSTVTASGSIDIDDGTWHHVMGTYDGAKVAIYIDGILDASTDTEGTIDIGNDWLTYGQNLGWLNDDVDGDGIRDGDDEVQNSTLEGVMDEVRVHSIGLPWRSDNLGNPETSVDADSARSVVSIYRTHCGHDNCGGNYLPGDLDESCYVDLTDAKIMAEEWLDCSSIDRAFCDDFWIP